MNDATKPEEPTAISSAPAISLDAGLAAGFGRRADGATSLLAKLSGKYRSVPPVLLLVAQGDSGHVLRPKSDAMPKQAETGDRYQLAGEIARGGMGAVLRGRDVELGRELAIKVLLEQYVDRPDIARRFIEEAQIGGQLQHPGIVPVYDIGNFGERPFFTMKLVKGRTLAAILSERSELAHDRPRLLTIALQVAQTLAYAHAKGVIHRDLKPANIMVGAFGEVQVMDWGLAKVLAEGGIADEEQASRAHRRAGVEPTVIRTARSGSAGGGGSDTEAGSLLGTPAYMPPEQALGDVANLDRRADVFGLGAILCEILTGKPPYVGRSGEEVRRKAANGDLADARVRLAACETDAELIALTTGCLSPEAIDRPKDAQEVTSALTAYLDGVQERLRRAELDKAAAEARTAEEVNTRRMAEARAIEERKRQRTQMALAVAVVALFGLAAGGVWYQQRQRAAAQAERASRRAATAASIAESLVDARRRMAEAWELPSFPDRMNAATEAADAAVHRADDYAAGEPTEASRAELAAIRAPLADLARHTRLVVDLERIQDGPYKWDSEGDEDSRDTAIRRLEAAARRFGLDPLGVPEDRTARAIAADPLRDTLIGLLSAWQQFVLTHDEHRAAIDRLGRVMRLTRLQCGGAYARWQGLLDRKDWKGLAAFAASPGWLELGPQLVSTLARDLSDRALDHEAARDLLRAAVERYPNAVPTRFDLADSCKTMSPPRNLEALQQYAALAALKPDALLFHYHLAETYAALGDFAQASVVHRKAADRGSVVSAHDMGVHYFTDLGDLDGAIASYRQALAIPSTTPHARGWKSRSEKDLAYALHLKTLEGRLPGLLRGEDNPGSASETVDAAELCALKRLYTDGTRFYARAFALDPKLADQWRDRNRYAAACCAALGAAGRGDDATALDESVPIRLRRQALDWLRAELAAMTPEVAGGQPDVLMRLKYTLSRWHRDRKLAGIRDADALAKLPAGEREAFAKLWVDVEALEKKIAEGPK
jgi:eukaryotic-like serine/threonine-protein kinase